MLDHYVNTQSEFANEALSGLADNLNIKHPRSQTGSVDLSHVPNNQEYEYCDLLFVVVNISMYGESMASVTNIGRN